MKEGKKKICERINTKRFHWNVHMIIAKYTTFRVASHLIIPPNAMNTPDSTEERGFVMILGQAKQKLSQLFIFFPFIWLFSSALLNVRCYVESSETEHFRIEIDIQKFTFDIFRFVFLDTHQFDMLFNRLINKLELFSPLGFSRCMFKWPRNEIECWINFSFSDKIVNRISNRLQSDDRHWRMCLMPLAIFWVVSTKFPMLHMGSQVFRSVHVLPTNHAETFWSNKESI